MVIAHGLLRDSMESHAMVIVEACVVLIQTKLVERRALDASRTGEDFCTSTV